MLGIYEKTLEERQNSEKTIPIKQMKIQSRNVQRRNKNGNKENVKGEIYTESHADTITLIKSCWKKRCLV